jgi:hypothetical protein
MRRLEENENYRPISLRDYVLECIQFLKLEPFRKRCSDVQRGFLGLGEALAKEQVCKTL